MSFSEHLLVLRSIGRTEREQPLPPGSRAACSLHGDNCLYEVLGRSRMKGKGCKVINFCYYKRGKANSKGLR